MTEPSEIPDLWLTQLKQTEHLVQEMARVLPRVSLHDTRRRALAYHLWDLDRELSDLTDDLQKTVICKCSKCRVDFKSG